VGLVKSVAPSTANPTSNFKSKIQALIAAARVSGDADVAKSGNEEESEEEKKDMPPPIKSLTAAEREGCIRHFQAMQGGVGDLEALQALLNLCGQILCLEDLQNACDHIGLCFDRYRRDSYMDLDTFLRLMQYLKDTHVDQMQDPDFDTLEAFLAMGGNADGTGHVATDVLSTALTSFGLSEDVAKTIAAGTREREGSEGVVKYEHFKVALKVKAKDFWDVESNDFVHQKGGQKDVHRTDTQHKLKMFEEAEQKYQDRLRPKTPRITPRVNESPGHALKEVANRLTVQSSGQPGSLSVADRKGSEDAPSRDSGILLAIPRLHDSQVKARDPMNPWQAQLNGILYNHMHRIISGGPFKQKPTLELPGTKTLLANAKRLLLKPKTHRKTKQEPRVPRCLLRFEEEQRKAAEAMGDVKQSLEVAEATLQRRLKVIDRKAKQKYAVAREGRRARALGTWRPASAMSSVSTGRQRSTMYAASDSWTYGSVGQPWHADPEPWGGESGRETQATSSNEPSSVHETSGLQWFFGSPGSPAAGSPGVKPEAMDPSQSLLRSPTESQQFFVAGGRMIQATPYAFIDLGVATPTFEEPTPQLHSSQMEL